MSLCHCLSTSPLCRGLQYFDCIYGEAVWSARYSVLSISDAGVICISSFRATTLSQRKYSGLVFFNSGVFTSAQIQDRFSQD